MQSDALVEAMARAIAETRYASDAARAALAALRQHRPDLAAVMDGEAVAVPKVATPEMIAATGYVGRDNEMRGLFFIMATASPYAPPPECAP